MLDVVVVGAGLSGLVVAVGLPKTARFAIVESSSRFGGRLLNSPEGIDLGAAWVWPGQKNLIDLLFSLNIETFDQPDDPSTLRVVGGAAIIAERLAAQLPEGSLHLGWELASCSCADGIITVQSASGNSIQAKHVVLAIPPRILSKRVCFVPDLETRKQRAMSLSRTWMAGVTKVALIFNKRWWPTPLNCALQRDGPAFQVYDGSSARGEVLCLTFFCLCDPSEDDESLGRKCAAQLQEYLSSPDDVNSFDRVVVQRWPLEHFVSDESAPTTIHPHPYPQIALGEPDFAGLLHFACTESDQSSPGLMEGAVGAANRVLAELHDAGI